MLSVFRSMFTVEDFAHPNLDEVRRDLGSRLQTSGENVIDSEWNKPDDFTLEKFSVGNVPVERMINHSTQGNQVMLVYHGGGYIAPLMDMYRIWAEFLSRTLSIKEVYLFDYRVAPKDVYPAAFEDAMQVYKYAVEHVDTNKFITFGDSAGGGLMFANLLKAKEDNLPMPRKIIALSPWVDLTAETSSMTYNAQRDMLLGIPNADDLSTADFMQSQAWNSAYATSEERQTNKYVSPILGDFRGFPETLIFAGQHEVLLSQSLLLLEKLTACGCDATLHIEKAMPHDYVPLNYTPANNVAYTIMKEFLK